MFRIFLYFGLIFISNAVRGQSQFEASNCFQLNDSSFIGFAVVTENFDGQVSQTGSNYVWDYSSTGTPGPWTNWAEPTVPYHFMPSSESIHSPFNSTEINEYAVLPFARDHFYTYSSQQDTLYFNGHYASSNNQYLPAIPYLTFPLSYTDSVFTTTEQSASPGLVSRYWIYDGYGMLKLPYGDVDDVVRIRTHQVDSSYVLNMVLSTQEELIWFRLSDGIPVLRFIKQGETTMAAYYASASSPMGINTFVESNTIRTFPNPVADFLNVEGLENGQPFEIYDLTGKLITRDVFRSNGIQLAGLQSGSYVLRITSENGQSIVSRFVK